MTILGCPADGTCVYKRSVSDFGLERPAHVQVDCLTHGVGKGYREGESAEIEAIDKAIVQAVEAQQADDFQKKQAAKAAEAAEDKKRQDESNAKIEANRQKAIADAEERQREAEKREGELAQDAENEPDE